MLLQTCCRRLAIKPASMPLRAKITNPAMAGSSRNFASSPPRPSVNELPGDEPNDVLFNAHHGIRTIALNRPTKLNSLNGSMARKIVPRLQEWEKSQMANVIVAKGEGRAFCAGGDVAALAQQNASGPAGQQSSKDYFALEYQLDHKIATYSKPYVAFLDGITMGGGVGLSVHAPFRIATENTVFAMPETTIGFFPDVGASFFLPRMDGELGMYLALTSTQLRSADVFLAGIATHYLHSSSLPDLEARLAELTFRDSMSLPSRLQIINATIEEFTTGLPPSPSPITSPIRTAIDYAFQPANTTLPAILNALEGMATMSDDSSAASEIKPWAAKTRDTILARSPLSVAVALRQLREGASWSIAETFRREHAIASKFMEHADFVEGVSALLIRKPKTTPQWQHASSPPSDAEVDAFFAAKPGLELLSGEDYHEYPHAWIGLPREREVQAFVEARGGRSREEVLEHFLSERGGKLGVREKVEEVLERKTSVGKDGAVAWKR